MSANRGLSIKTKTKDKSATLSQKVSKVDQSKCTITLSKIRDFYAFERGWKHFGSCTQLNKIYNKGIVVFRGVIQRCYVLFLLDSS